MPAGNYTEESGLAVKVFVKGKQLACETSDCSIALSYGHSPFISAVIPSAVYPGQEIKAIGFVKASSTSQINRIQVGEFNCILPEDEVSLSQTSKYEDVSCNLGDDVRAGEHAFNFESKNGIGFAGILEMANIYSFADDNKHNVRVHPLVKSLSSNVGYTGGQVLTINGSAFGTDKSKVTVEVEGITAEVLEVSNEEIKVKLGDDQRTAGLQYYKGGAGLRRKVYDKNQSVVNFQADANYPNPTGVNVSVDDIILSPETFQIGSLFVQRMTGLFCASIAGEHKFLVSSNDDFQLMISSAAFDFSAGYTETSSDVICSLTAWTGFRDFYKYPSDQSCSKTLVADTCYYIMIIQRDKGGDDNMTVTVKMPNPGADAAAQAARKGRSPQVSLLTLTHSHDPEKVSFKVGGAKTGKYVLHYKTAVDGKVVFDKVTDEIAYGTTAATFRTKVRNATKWWDISVERKTYDQSDAYLDETDLSEEQIVSNAYGFEYIITFDKPRNYIINPTFFPVEFKDEDGDDVVPVTSYDEAVQLPSPLVKGSYKVKIGDEESVDIDINANEGTIEYELRRMDVLKKGVSVRDYGDNFSGRTIYIEFNGNKGETIAVELITSITGGPIATPATLVHTVHTAASDELFFNSIPSDMLFTLSDKPQINVKVDSLYAACPNDKCDYDIAAPADTLTILSFTRTGAELTIVVTTASESMADANLLVAPDLEITFGASTCVISSIALPNIVCDLPKNADDTPMIEAGDHLPIVHLNNRGYLSYSTSPAVTPEAFPIAITSISPTTASAMGNIDITIVGTGLSSNTVVQINGNDCVISTATNQQIVCKVPANQDSDGAMQADTGTTTVALNTKTDTSSDFSYDTAITPTITAISPTSASPVLKTDLTITGTNFSSTKEDLLVRIEKTELYNGKKIIYDCNIITSTETSITCRLPGGYSGANTIVVFKKTIGDSLPDADANVLTYEITFTSISPTSGSLNGGTLLTITGQNFSTIKTENVVLTDKDSQLYCDIESATITEIKCRTRKPKTTLTGPNNVIVYGRIIEEGTCATTCTFEYLASDTPSIATMSPNSAIAGATVTITGSMLDSPNEIYAEFGSVKVDIPIANVNSSGTILTFPMPALPQSTRTLTNLHIGGRGSATQPAQLLTISTPFQLTSFTPNTGSIFGAEVDIVGNGFSQDDAVIYVTDGDKKLSVKVLSFTTSLIKIEFPSVSGTNSPYKITIEQFDTAIESTSVYATIADSPKIDYLPVVNFVAADSIDFVLKGVNLSHHPVADANIKLVSLAGNGVEVVGTLAYTPITQGDPENEITATFANLPVGQYEIRYWINNVGFAKVTVSLNTINVSLGAVTLTSVQSSFNGGKDLVINGKGFSQSEGISVSVCGLECPVSSVDFNSVTCSTPAFVNKTLNDSLKIKTSAKLTPAEVTGNSISSLASLNDGNFNTNTYSGENDCSFTFDFGEHKVAVIDKVKLFPKLNHDETILNGAVIEGSNDNTTFTNMATLAGTIENWNDFFPKTATWAYRYVRFKGNKCNISQFEVFGVIVSDVSSINATSHNCDVGITIKSSTTTESNGVEYRSDKTSRLTNIEPAMGTTAGGTVVTFTGDNFDKASTSITIDGVACVLDDANSSDTVLKCTTGARTTFVESTLVIKSDNGIVSNQGLSYLYIDRWSSDSTWGGESPPREGDSVFVPKGQNLLMDVSPPRLKAVIVEGSLIWADEEDMTFDAYFLFVRDGKLEIGTEEKPHLNKLTITMYGDKGEDALPGMGNKLIGGHNAVIDIHGKKRVPTWTLLETTINPGESQLTVQVPVDWQAGEKIILAPTANSKSQFEEHIIKEVSADFLTITIEGSFKHKHFAETLSHGGKTFEVRGEVGLMTRNVLIQGDETTDETRHGVHIMMKGDENIVKGRISYIEMNRCGQGFELGRYPIHFHMVGNVIDSYVIGNSIHHSNNRGTTIHGVHYLHVKKNVYYIHKGHGVFFEDSIETNNVVEDNLIMRTQVASSLLKSDLSPAGIWVTRPLNFINRNHVVGSASFGIWFELPGSPTGPSADSSICIAGERLGTLDDNVMHANGIGLRIYPVFKPREDACQSITDPTKVDMYAHNPPVTANFNRMLVYSNGLGFFGRDVGAIKLTGWGFISNGTGASVQKPESAPLLYPQIHDSVIVSESRLTEVHGHKTGTGFVAPQKDGFLLDSVTFENFNGGTIMKMCNACDSERKKDKGGRLTTTRNLTFTNVSASTNIISYNDAKRDKDILRDEDGTLLAKMGFAATGGGWITPYFPHLNVPECQQITDTKMCDELCVYCNETIEVRRADFKVNSGGSQFRGLTMKIYNYDKYTNWSTILTTEDDYSLIPARDFTGFRGWAVPFVTTYHYNNHWQKGVDWKKLQLDIDRTYDINDKSYYLRFNNTSPRELYRGYFSGITNNSGGASHAWKYISGSPLQDLEGQPGSSNAFGDFNYANNLLEIKMDRSTGRGKVWYDRVICFNTCPPDEGEAEEDEETFRRWSNASDWDSGEIPKEGEEIEIPSGWRMILDVATPLLKKLKISGLLRADTAVETLSINAYNVYISKNGRLEVGDETTPFPHDFSINIYGQFDSEHVILDSLIEPPNKALIVAGKLGMFGLKKTPVWTRLAKMGLKGDTTLSFTQDVNWKVNDELVIASTSMDSYEVEYVKITAINADNLKEVTIDPPLKHNHFGNNIPHISSVGTLDMRAEVGVLTRNLKIVGANDSDWGCRIITPRFSAYNIEKKEIVDTEGTTIMEGVEIIGCGQRDTYQGALDFQYLSGANSSELDNIVIRDGKGIGVNLYASSNVHLKNSIITNVVKFGIYVRIPKDLSFVGNLILNIKEREDYENDEIWDPMMGFYYDDRSYLAAKNVLVTDNSISAVPHFAFFVPGHQCGTTNTHFLRNSGHTAMAGWFAGQYPQTRNGADCMAYSDFIGYKNHDEGFVNRYEIHELKLYNMIMADNANSIAMNGGSSSGKKFPKSELKNSIIYGKANLGCDFCYKKERECKTNGIFTSIFEQTSYEFILNINEIPLHNITSPKFLWGGKQLIEATEFVNFQKTEDCDESFAIRTNNFVQDTSADVILRNNVLKNVHETNYFYFFNHTRIKFPTFCAKRDCTGIYNINIQDQTGNFFGFPTNNFNNRGISKDGNCTYRAEWNGFACQDKYMLLSMQQNGGGRGNIISPLDFKIYKDDAIVAESDKYRNIVDNQNDFAALVKKNSYHHIEFSQSMPSNVIYKLDSYKTNSWAVFRVQITDPATMKTTVNGNETKLLIVDEETPFDFEAHKKDCGAHAYFHSNYTLFFVVNASSNCVVKVHKTDSVKIAMRLDIPVKEFYSTLGATTFIDRIAGLLGIPTHRLRIVEIREGSTIVYYTILPKEPEKVIDSVSGEITTIEQSSEDVNNELTELKNRLIDLADVISSELNIQVLNIDAHVVLIEKEEDLEQTFTTEVSGFAPYCRFYSFDEYEIILSQEEEDKLEEEKKREFIQINCKDCEIVNQCKKFLSIACDINDSIIGKDKCDNIEDCKDCFGNDENDDSGSYIVPLVSLLVVLINYLA